MLGVLSASLRSPLLELGLLACLTVVPAIAASPAEAPLRFFVVGDAPYSDAEYAPFDQLLRDAGEQSPPFIVHLGDIKGGGQPCSDARSRRVAALFQSQRVPLLYTPGDNEWTDCHRLAAGRRDPLERLEALRAHFFGEPAVLHNQALGLVVPDAGFPENGYMIRDGVVFVVIHVVGSKNNRRPKVASAMAEWRLRSAANRALVDAATEAASRAKARAIVMLFHANPLFEEAPPEPGFQPLLDDLERLLREFPGPVLVVHGDTHRFQFNQPLASSRLESPWGERLWRLEVPGSPFLGGVWVTVTEDPQQPFTIELVYPRADKTF